MINIFKCFDLKQKYTYRSKQYNFMTLYIITWLER